MTTKKIGFFFLFLVLLASCAQNPTFKGKSAEAAHSNPFETLSEKEFSELAEILKEGQFFKEGSYISYAANYIPPKSEVLASAPVLRRGLVQIYDKKTTTISEYVISFADRKVTLLRHLKNQPHILMPEYDEIVEIVKKSPEWIAAIKKRGFDPSDIYVDGWAAGLLTKQQQKSGKRFMRGLSYYKGKNENIYARPIEGLIITVNMTDGVVHEVWDKESAPVAAGAQDFSPEVLKGHTTEFRALKKLETIQPDGPSFTADNGEVVWNNWRFKYSFDQMKGVVLHQVEFYDRGTWRSVLYTGYLSEMVVPYGDPSPAWAFRNAFDVGEYGLGKTTHSLQKGLDVPENSKFFDVFMLNENSSLLKIENAIALYERMGGVSWKHMDANNRMTYGRPARELVLTFTGTIGNYDYGLSWVFHEEGTLEQQVHLTGILLAKGVELTQNPCVKGCKPMVEKNILAPAHQHFFNFHLDLDVDGNLNTPMEANSKAIPKGKNNPFGNSFEIVNTPLLSEKSAVRDHNPTSARKWKLVNSDSKNSYGHPRGYMIMSGETATMYLSKDSDIRKRAQFASHPIWFTKYTEGEFWAAGQFPNQNFIGEGLPQYIKNDDFLKQQDSVLWYTFGVTHHPRPEEWPVMSSHKAGFKLMPVNFFDRNPAM